MKKILQIVAVVLGLSLSIQAGVHYSLDDFNKPGVNGNIDLMHVNDFTYMKTAISPDLKLGDFELGFDINIYLPLEDDSPYPSDLAFITFRHISYNYQNKHAITYGRLRNVTLGQGLLMQGYDSGAWGSTQFSNEKAGVKGFTTYKQLRADALWTAQNVQGARLSYRFENVPSIPSPIIVGATIVSDPDGEDRTYSNQRIRRAKQEGTAIDISIPLGGDYFVPYAEYAELTTLQKAKGGAIGIKGDFFTRLQYKFEYRKLGERFVPGYFNYTYHSSSFDFNTDAPDKEIHGYLASISSSFLENRVKAGAMYEKYDADDLFTASLGFDEIARTTAVANYQVPFQGNKNRILEADAIIRSGRAFDYIVNYKRIYYTSDDYEEFYTTGLRFNLGSNLGFGNKFL